MKDEFKKLFLCIVVFACGLGVGLFLGLFGCGDLERELNQAITNQQETETRIESITRQLEDSRGTINRIAKELDIERATNKRQRDLNKQLIESNTEDTKRVEGITDLNREAEKIIRECLELFQ